MPESIQNLEHLRRAARDRGANVFGAASMEILTTDPPPPASPDLDRFPFAISVGIHLSDAILEELGGGPTRQYTYHYKVVNYQLDSIGLVLVSLIQELGFNAYPVPASQVLEWDRNTGELSHKWVAYHAGLGWYGRNNLFINPKYGARVRYATVLTDMPLAPGNRLDQDCGDCYNCLQACPAGAIGKSRKDFDLEKCSAKIKELRDKRNLGHYVCGLCIKACPGTRK